MIGTERIKVINKSTVSEMRLKKNIAIPQPEKITFRASVETVVAMVIAILGIVYFGTIKYFVIASCIAPVLLLRSEASQNLGLRWFSSVLGSIKKSSAPPLLFVLIIPLASLVIRPIATLRYPFQGLRAFPDNWKNVVWCRPILYDLEFVPGSGPIDDVLGEIGDDVESQAINIGWLVGLVFLIFVTVIRVTEGYWLVESEDSWVVVVATITGIFFAIVVIVATAAMMILGGMYQLARYSGYVMAALYRFSLKSTALLWLSMTFNVQDSNKTKDSLPELLDEIKDSSVWELVRIISFIVIAQVLIEFIFWPSLVATAGEEGGRILNAFFVPGKITWWQLAATTNSLLILIFYYGVLDPTRSLIEEEPSKIPVVARAMRGFYYTRAFLTTVTIPILLIIALNAANWVKVEVTFIPELAPKFERDRVKEATSYTGNQGS